MLVYLKIHRGLKKSSPLPREGFANSHIGSSTKVVPLGISCLIKSFDLTGSYLLDVSSQHLLLSSFIGAVWMWVCMLVS